MKMPGQVIHAKASLGPTDVNEFMKTEDHNVQSGSFRAPGRHFTTTEIRSVVAMIIVQFDIYPLASQDGAASDIKNVVSDRDVHEVFSGNLTVLVERVPILLASTWSRPNVWSFSKMAAPPLEIVSLHSGIAPIITRR